MQKHLGSAMRIGKRIGLSDERGVYVAVFVALIVVACTVAVYYVWFGPKPEAYNTVSLLDVDQKAIDYPNVLVLGQNSSFNVYVQVGNHQNSDADYQVQVKVTKNLPASIPNGVPSSPVATVDFSVPNGQTKQNQATVTMNDVGVYSVVYELWIKGSDGAYKFTGDFAVLNIEVTD